MNSVNLIPAHRRAQRQARRAQRHWIIGGATYFALLTVSGVGIMLASASTTTGVQTRLTLATDRQTELSGQSNERRARLAELDRQFAANQVMDMRPDWSRLIETIRDCAGEAIVLRSLGVEPTSGGTRPTQLADNRRFLVPVSGYALSQGDVSRFALALERIELFDRVSIESTGRAQVSGRDVISFELALQLTDGTATAPVADDAAANSNPTTNGAQP